MLKKYTTVIIMALFTFLNNSNAATPDSTLMLSDKQISDFYEVGYVVVPNFFTPSEVKTALEGATYLQKEAEMLIADNQSGKVMHNGTQFVIDKFNGRPQIQRIVWIGAAQPQLLELSRQKKLLVKISQILGSDEADHLINQLHYKLPNDGVEFPWHQDIQHRRKFDKQWKDLNGRGSFVQSLITLDNMNTANGAIYVVPSSHKFGNLDLASITDARELNKKIHIDQAIALEMQPGDLVLMHPLLVHGSKPNQSTEPRRILINGFSYPGANHEPYPGTGSAQRIGLL